jgi:KaiC/GvpD/RAD55 family RecA-like ATPase
MFRNTIKGLSKVVYTEIPEGSTLLVTGGPGTLKSSLAYTILSNHLASKNEFGLYITLEESKESHERNMKSLGINIYPGLKIFDYQDIRREYEGELNIIKGVEDAIKFYMEKEKKFTCIAVDSLNAVYSLMELTKLRAKMYNFFDTFKRYKLTSIIILETETGRERGVDGGERFLADGIINMGTMKVKDDITIYMQIEKMRATKHSRRKYQIGIDDNGLSVLGHEYE